MKTNKKISLYFIVVLTFLVTMIIPASANYEHIIQSSDGEYQCIIHHVSENNHGIMPQFINSLSECENSYGGT